MSIELKIIVVTGPESSGKSYLAKLLAEKFRLPLVAEYAREYIGGLERDYVEEDLEAIAVGQYEKLNEIIKSGAAWVIMDTDFLTIKIWGTEKYGKYSVQLKQLSERYPTTHYLCCRPDIPWEYDPQRENPEDRDRLFEIHYRELEKQKCSFDIIEGDFEQRTAMAVRALEKLIH